MKVLKQPIFLLCSLLITVSVQTAFAQTNVTINASTALVTIPNEIFGSNMSAYTNSNNGTDAAYVTAMQVSGSRNIRWPGGSYSDLLNWNNILCQASYYATTPQYISFLQKFGGTMQAIVNFSGYWCGATNTHTQAVSLAAAWVTWNMTNTGSARAKYWEVGNENYGSWEQGGAYSGTTYGQYFADYYKAMKAVDSTILIGAVASPGSTDYSNWTPNLLTAAKAAGVVPDFLIVHNYPDPGTGTGSATDANILNYPVTIATQTANLNSIVSSVLGSSYVGQVKYFMTEYNSSLGPGIQTIEYVNAMFVSQWILETAKNGWIGANLWAAKNGASSNGADYGFIDVNTDTPHPDYYVFPMLTGKFGKNMVSCTSSNALVRAYAAKDASGNLTLFLVNNSPTAANPANITVSGFTPAASGQAWVMLPSGSSASGAPQEVNGSKSTGPPTRP